MYAILFFADAAHITAPDPALYRALGNSELAGYREHTSAIAMVGQCAKFCNFVSLRHVAQAGDIVEYTNWYSILPQNKIEMFSGI
jgi:hypothetical protein